MRKKIDIVLPCYNPMPGWYKQLNDFRDSVSENYDLNFIIVNDGSQKEVFTEIVKKKLPEQTRYINYSTNKGKGYALRKGMEASVNEFIIYTDIDFPFTNESIHCLMEALVSNTADVIVGYRPDTYYQNKMSWFRRFLSKAFRFFVKKALKMPVSDTQCGLKGFNVKGRELFLKTSINRYLFDFEFIYKVTKQTGLKIKPVQVRLKENVVFSKMKLKIIVQELFNLSRILLSS